jgi:hypothetical protein
MTTRTMIDVATVRNLSNPADINRLLIDAVALERTIDADLEALLSSSSQVDTALAALKSETTAALQVAKTEATQLRSSTADTAALADKVSSKVRALDAAQSRVRSTLSRIEVVVDRSRAVEGVQSALERDDLEAAAGCIARFLEIEDEEKNHLVATTTTADGANNTAGLLGSNLVHASSGIAEQEAAQVASMVEWKGKVEKAVRTRTAAAVAAKDHGAVARYAGLYGPLRMQSEGVEVITNYLRALLSERAQADYDALVDGFAAGAGAKVDYVEALTNLFRDVAAAIDEHVDLFRDAFGPEMALTAVYAVHAECDIRGTRILQRFVDHRGLARVAGQIGMRRRDDTSAAAAPVEPRRVEGFLSELLALCTRGEEYTQYLLVRMAEASAPSPLPPARETALRGGALSTTLRELLSYYISLEEYYVEESVAKAVRIDEPVAGALTSSMVDDAFFVALSAGRRALATGRAPSAVAILNQLNTALSTLYRSALARKLQGAASRLAAASPTALASNNNYTSGGDGGAGAGAASVAALAFNNADMSAMYVDKLRQQLEDLAGQLFPAPHDRDRIKLVLADLTKTAADFRRLSAQGAEQLCNALSAHLRPLLDQFVEISYELDGNDGTGAGGAAAGGAPQWAHALVVTFASNFSWLQSYLTPTLYDTVIHSAVDKVAARMEAAISQKRFTQLGGLQLEREIRSLVVGLSDLSSRSVREKFAKLRQTATVLGLESAEEAAELVSDGDVAWRLSPLDVRQALSQRVEFSPAAVAAVKLH